MYPESPNANAVSFEQLSMMNPADPSSVTVSTASDELDRRSRYRYIFRQVRFTLKASPRGGYEQL